MTDVDYQSTITWLAAICPSGRLATALDRQLSPLLESAQMFLPPSVYSRFTITLFVYPLMGELLTLASHLHSIVVLPLVILQVIPFVIPISKGWSRRKKVDSEFLFFLAFTTSLGRDASQSFETALRRVASDGSSILPAFALEGSIIERDLTYLSGCPAEIVERTLSTNPSKMVRRFFHGLTETRAGGTSGEDFVRDELRKQAQTMLTKQRENSSAIGFLIGVSLMSLSFLLVGPKAITGAPLGRGETQLVLFVIVLLEVCVAILLPLMNRTQLVPYGSRKSLRVLYVPIFVSIASTELFLSGYFQVQVWLVLPLVIAIAAGMNLRRIDEQIGKEDEEIARAIQRLVEDVRTGAAPDESLTKALRVPPSSIEISLSAFRRSGHLRLNLDMIEYRTHHTSWLVRFAFWVVSQALEKGIPNGELEELSLFFKAIAERSKSTRAFRTSLAFGATLGVIVITGVSYLTALGATSGLSPPFVFTGLFKDLFLVILSGISAVLGALIVWFI